MAILGKIDAATFSNNVAVTNGDATVTKNAADTVVVGDVLELGNVAYIVKQVNSTTSIELHKNICRQHKLRFVWCCKENSS